MAERNATEILSLRLPLYAYLAPLWQGRRVLEIACGDGGSADYLGQQGAEWVLAVDVDAGRVDRARARHGGPRVEFRAVSDLRQLATAGERFDVVLVPEGQATLGLPDLITVLRALLTEMGHVIVAVPAADRKGRQTREGVGYYDLADALTAHFSFVRMLGQTPFLGFGLVEFDGSADALRVDVSLLHGGAEHPSHYVAIAGAVVPPSLGYSLVQVPFAPVEALVLGGNSGRTPVPLAAAAADNPGASDGRAEMAERRLEEAERRARGHLEDAELRLADLRRKLEDALIQAESAVRISRAQADEIEELRARIRRGAEDRVAADDDLGRLRRALAQADESVLTLTRRTAEELAVVAEKMVTGLARVGPAAAPPEPAGEELLARTRHAEEASVRDRAEIAALLDRIRAADEEIRALGVKAAAVSERDDRIARLEGDKQDLVWRVAELEEKLRHAVVDREALGPTAGEVASARSTRDRAIEEFHRGAAAHANEVLQLQASVAEQAALVVELEDAVRTAEVRAAAADKEATTLRRNAKDLEEADRARRGRLAELEGKLLRLERQRAEAAALGDVDAAGSETSTQGLAQRSSAAEQRAFAAEQRAAAAEERVAILSRQNGTGRNGHHDGGMPPAEMQAAVAGIEERLRDEMRTLGAIEETLGRAREEAARAARIVDADVDARADLERALAAKDSQLVEGRLELARLRRDSESRQVQLEREMADLRGRLNPTGYAGMSDDLGGSAQLILMHSTLANIRRRSARLRDELEGFRRRLDTLPPGALSSMLEEIGEDLAEFAK
jgi:SAM-dependent methyltransferase